MAGRIETLDPHLPRVEALAVVGGRIVARGDARELAAAFPRFQRVDLGGGVVLPGFIDAHIHLPGYGLALRLVDLRTARSVPEAVEAVRAAVLRAQPGEWIRGRGWDKNVWEENRFPTRHDLDAATAGHPVILSSKDGHLLWVNSAALRAAGVDRRTPDPPGGAIDREPRMSPPAS